MNYTKGEWKIREVLFKNFLIVVNDKNIACVYPTDDKNSEFNANLIAAAPDMYEALKALEARMQDIVFEMKLLDGKNRDCLDATNEILAASRALAKAEDIL
jgi:hypothetical protein